jgi:putative LysE/RhtB family amino acid efflux pump
LLDLPGLRVVLGVVGAAVLVWLGSRTLWASFRVRSGAEADVEVASPRAAFATSLAATASNPLTIASWAAVFAAASVGDVTATASTTILFVLAIGIGSFLWFAALALGFSFLGRRAGPRSHQTVDMLAGAGLVGFGGLLAWRVTR